MLDVQTDFPTLRPLTESEKEERMCREKEKEQKRRLLREYKGCSSFYGHDDRTSTTYVMQGYDDHKEKTPMPPPPMKGSVAGAFLKLKGSVAGAFLKRCRSRSLRKQPPRGPVFSKKKKCHGGGKQQLNDTILRPCHGRKQVINMGTPSDNR